MKYNFKDVKVVDLNGKETNVEVYKALANAIYQLSTHHRGF